MNSDISQLLDHYESGRITRRQLVAAMGTLAAMMGGAGKVLGDGHVKKAASTFKATELNHIALRVTDVPRSRDFYIKHLGMEISRQSQSNCFLTFGNHFLALFQGDEAEMDHYCYSIKNFDVDDAEKKLRAAGLEPDVHDERIYFPDPDGLTVQLASESHSPRSG